MAPASQPRYSGGQLNAGDRQCVLQVVPTYLPATRYGGPILSVHALGRELAVAGHTVHVATTSVDGERDSDVPLEVAVDVDGVKVWYSRSHYLRRIYWSRTLGRRVDALLPIVDILHLHSVFLWPTLRAARAARARGVPYVLSPRGMLVPELIAARGRLRKQAWIALFERSNLRGAAMIHATSRVEHDDLLRMDLGQLPPVSVIPNGVDISDDPGLPRDGSFIFVGRLSWKKRIDWIVRALVQVRGATLDVLGPDTESVRTQLQELAQQLGVSQRVNFHGEANRMDRDRMLWRARALILPSVSENFGNVVAEALACGCPAIVTPGVGAAELVRAAGAGRIVENETELAYAMLQMQNNPGLATALGSNGRGHVRRELGWPAVARQMACAYRDAIARTRAVDR